MKHDRRLTDTLLGRRPMGLAVSRRSDRPSIPYLLLLFGRRARNRVAHDRPETSATDVGRQVVARKTRFVVGYFLPHLVAGRSLKPLVMTDVAIDSSTACRHEVGPVAHLVLLVWYPGEDSNLQFPPSEGGGLSSYPTGACSRLVPPVRFERT